MHKCEKWRSEELNNLLKVAQLISGASLAPEHILSTLLFCSDDLLRSNRAMAKPTDTQRVWEFGRTCLSWRPAWPYSEAGEGVWLGPEGLVLSSGIVVNL